MQYNEQIKSLYATYDKSGKVSTDTRAIKEGSVFFALSGAQFNGNKFAGEALEKGAIACVMDDAELAAPLQKEGHEIFVVEDVLKTLQDLASYHRDQFDYPVIAITGSNGKTTTKELCNFVLAHQWDVLATEGNLNNHIGVPLTLLSWPTSLHMGIVEMGANHKGEIASYCEIAKPDFGLITNCGKAHLEGFGSLEGVIEAKTELFDYLKRKGGKIFLNEDLDYLKNHAQRIEIAMAYGQNAGLVQGEAQESNPLIVKLNAPFEESLHSQLLGSYNVDNILAAVAVGLHFEVPMPLIKVAIAKYAPQNQRSQWVDTGKNKLLLDAYNANPSSMHLALDNALSFGAENVVLCLGGMNELGDFTEKEHNDLIDKIKQYNWKAVYLVGPHFKNNHGEYQHFDTISDLKNYFQSEPLTDATVLIKGSRSAKMEELLEVL